LTKVENAHVFDAVGSRHRNKIRAPLQDANDVWVGNMFQGDFLKNHPSLSPFTPLV
jgi:hypothetical protein